MKVMVKMTAGFFIVTKKALQLAQVLGDIKNHYKSPSGRTTLIIQNEVSTVRNEILTWKQQNA